MTNPLAELLRGRIGLSGPITVADFMAEALGHPEYGYYITRDPLGAVGDFTTAPEISQMFGELVGLWSVQVWRSISAPKPFHLVELGPGRGTLMADALRAARLAPEFLDAASVHLVETSPVLAEMQRRSLASHEAKWHDSLEAVPDGPAIVIANEFFDALPIRQFERTRDGWRERMVGLAGDGRSFRLGLSPGATGGEVLLARAVRETADIGEIAEVCPPGLSIMRTLAERIARHGGAALIVDYGHAASAPGDTLQAVRGHEYCDPLAEPGMADLTAHVDFAALASIAAEAGAAARGPVTQRDFLMRLGIETRAAQLLARATEAQATDIRAALSRLIGEKEMGYLFKAMAITPAGAVAPPAFEELSA